MISSEVKNQHEGKLVSNQFIVLLLTLLLDDDSDTIVLRKHDKIETLIDLTNDFVFFFLLRQFFCLNYAFRRRIRKKRLRYLEGEDLGYLNDEIN